ncbi:MULTISPECIES: hypothetical protein [Microcystis]|uniref:hypothetical protein n=1 Tax=Microcystis TaxID=1125 RepID=UPI000308801F|nr:MULTISPECIES: hypothetical protein [Microcystis]MDB9406406.1 hypothetical protein [Microcystis sp. CS-574]MDB9542520.1 hypothetical protein [Microcystis aeruginosa CS-1036]
MKRLPAKFFRAEGGSEPVKDWWKTLSREDCRIIGSDIKDVEFSFPIGCPCAVHFHQEVPKKTKTGNRFSSQS